MSAHSFNQDHFDSLELQFSEVADPGDAGTIEIEGVGKGVCKLVTAGAETRTLESADSLPVGLELLVILTTAGDATITYAAATTHVLTEAGDCVRFVVSNDGTNNVWKIESNVDVTAIEDVLGTVDFGDAPIDLGAVEFASSDKAALADLANALKTLGLIDGTFTAAS